MGEWDQNRIENKLSQDKLQWHFNPPASPHFGGAWERLVRSTKRALKAIAGEQCVNDETLLTFVAEAEAILNSRPLTPVSSDYRQTTSFLDMQVKMYPCRLWLIMSHHVVVRIESMHN